MRAVLDTNIIPDLPWQQWDTTDWPRYHDFWEHPMASELAKTCRYISVDWDADDFLKRMTAVWLPMLLTSELRGLAENYRDALREERDAAEKFHQVARLRYDKSNPDRRLLSDEAMNSGQQMRKAESAVYDRLVTLLQGVVASGWNLSDEQYPQALFQYFLNNMDEEERENYGDLFEDSGIDFLVEQNGVYASSLLRWPGENLPSYVHDQCLHQNFVQYTVYHTDESEMEMVENLTYLEDPEATMELLSNFRTWWT